MFQQEFYVKIKAFSSDEEAREYRVMVEENGGVWVWDSVAGNFTSCHILDEDQADLLRELARERAASMSWTQRVYPY